jgi:hypothetical protein
MRTLKVSFVQEVIKDLLNSNKLAARRLTFVVCWRFRLKQWPGFDIANQCSASAHAELQLATLTLLRLTLRRFILDLVRYGRGLDMVGKFNGFFRNFLFDSVSRLHSFIFAFFAWW